MTKQTKAKAEKKPAGETKHAKAPRAKDPPGKTRKRAKAEAGADL
jgi:hypothetical protein